MKKTYEQPEIELLTFKVTDITNVTDSDDVPPQQIG